MTEYSPRPNRWILAVIASALLLFFAYLLRYVLLPFIVAGALAFVSTPVVHWLQNRLRLPRLVAALIPFCILLALLALMGLAIYEYLLPQASVILRDQTAILERFLTVLFRGQSLQVGGKSYGPREVTQVFISSVGSKFDPREAVSDVAIVIGIFMGGVMSIVLLFYFLVEGPRVSAGLMWLVPPSIRPEVASIARRSGPVIFSYVRGCLLIVAYAIIVTFLVAKFALHVDHAMILAIAVGILELIPVIGPALSIALIAFIAIEQITFWGIIGVAVFATGLRVSIDQWVGPLVLGRAVKLPPPAIIFAFMAGGAIWGVLGVVIAIPAAAIIKIILEEAYGEGVK
jgi:predicted PurR-regulated permease PerM